MSQASKSSLWYCNAKSWDALHLTWAVSLKKIQNGGFNMAAIQISSVSISERNWFYEEKGLGLEGIIYAWKNNWKWRNYWLFFLRKYCMANIEETTSWALCQVLMRFFSELPWKNMGRGFEMVAILLKREDWPRDILGTYLAHAFTCHTSSVLDHWEKEIYGLSVSLSMLKKPDKLRKWILPLGVVVPDLGQFATFLRKRIALEGVLDTGCF